MYKVVSEDTREMPKTQSTALLRHPKKKDEEQIITKQTPPLRFTEFISFIESIKESYEIHIQRRPVPCLTFLNRTLCSLPVVSLTVCF